MKARSRQRPRHDNPTVLPVNWSGQSKAALRKPWRMWSRAHLQASRWARAARIEADKYSTGNPVRDAALADEQKWLSVADRITRKIGDDWHAAMAWKRSPSKT